MYIQSVFVWSSISNIEARAKNMNPKGIRKLYFKNLNLLIDFILSINGISTAWRWAEYRIK